MVEFGNRPERSHVPTGLRILQSLFQHILKIKHGVSSPLN